MAWRLPHVPGLLSAVLTKRLERLPTRTTEELMVFAAIRTDQLRHYCPPPGPTPGAGRLLGGRKQLVLRRAQRKPLPAFLATQACSCLRSVAWSICLPISTS